MPLAPVGIKSLISVALLTRNHGQRAVVEATVATGLGGALPRRRLQRLAHELGGHSFADLHHSGASSGPRPRIVGFGEKHARNTSILILHIITYVFGCSEVMVRRTRFERSFTGMQWQTC